MKILFTMIMSGFMAISLAYGKKTPHKKVKTKRQVQPNSRLSTDVKFGDATVLGQYSHLKDLKVTVEQEKKMIKVVEPRFSFRSQLEKSKGWYE